MAYSDFTLYEVTRRFQLTIDENSDLFPSVTDSQISPLLAEILRETAPLALAIQTEKARSELIIAPILVELRKLAQHQISLFSGVDFTVDPTQGLNGACDYIITRSTEQLFISSPVLMIIEAKKENIVAGMAQCMAAMIAARIFNEREANHISTIYGAVTTGNIWKFLKLENNIAFIDRQEYYFNNLSKILGVLRYIVGADTPVMAA
jgi:hypothetical protein